MTAMLLNASALLVVESRYNSRAISDFDRSSHWHTLALADEPSGGKKSILRDRRREGERQRTGRDVRVWHYTLYSSTTPHIFGPPQIPLLFTAHSATK